MILILGGIYELSSDTIAQIRHNLRSITDVIRSRLGKKFPLFGPILSNFKPPDGKVPFYVKLCLLQEAKEINEAQAEPRQGTLKAWCRRVRTSGDSR